MRPQPAASAALVHGLSASLDEDARAREPSLDGVTTLWVRPETLPAVLAQLTGVDGARRCLLLDLFCLDDTLGAADGGDAVTLVYTLLATEPFGALRLKVRAEGDPVVTPSARRFFANAEGYERALSASTGVCFMDPLSGAVTSRAHAARGPDARALPGDDERDADLSLARALALEALLGVDVPARAAAIRVLRAELLRVASHLSWFAAFVDEVGAMTPSSYAALDARRALDVATALSGAGRGGVVLGGVESDLPGGWRATLEAFLDEMRPRLRDSLELTLTSPTLQAASKGVCPIDVEAALSWGVTGPVLRSAGSSFDLRRASPYCGYAGYDLEVPTGVHGDVYDRVRVRLDELWQSFRVLEQCAGAMPADELRAEVPRDLVPGEAMAAVEGSRGVAACYVASDGVSLFVRHRTPAFPHLQALAAMSRDCHERERGAVLRSVDLGDRAAAG